MAMDFLLKQFPDHVSVFTFSKLTGLGLQAVRNRIEKGYIKTEKKMAEVILIPRSEIRRVKEELKKKGKMKPGRKMKGEE